MATIKLDTDTLQTLGQTIINRLDTGPGPALIEIYDGTMPATPGTGLGSQNLLGVLTCSDPCATYADKVITFGTITQDSAANASGTASWARLTTSDGFPRMLLDVGNTSSEAALKFNTTSIVAGGPIQVSSLTITIGA